MTMCTKCKRNNNNYLYAGNNNTELNKHHHVYKMSQKIVICTGKDTYRMYKIFQNKDK